MGRAYARSDTKAIARSEKSFTTTRLRPSSDSTPLIACRISIMSATLAFPVSRLTHAAYTHGYRGKPGPCVSLQASLGF